MTPSVFDHFERCLAGVVAPAGWTTLRRIAGGLPASLTGDFYIELRLDGSPQVDLSVWRGAPAPDLTSAALASRGPPWARIGRLNDLWTDPATRLCDVLRFVWIELDGADPEKALADPHTGIQLHPIRWGPAEFAEGAPAGAWLLDRLVPVLTGSPLDDRVVANVRRVMACVEVPGGLAHVSRMVNRGFDGIRLGLCMGGFAAARAFLARLGSATSDALSVFAFLDADAALFELQVDVGRDLHPRIGLEFRFRGDDTASFAPAFARLVDAGVCTAERAAAVSAAPGAMLVGGDPTPLVLVRTLAHLKLTFAPGTSPTAKAYLGLYERRPGQPIFAPAV